jgi:acyl-CoA thioester hydrolase
VAYSHSLRVRYGECDMQGVVFNSHYLAYVDDAFDTWMRVAVPGGFEAIGLDVMLKRSAIEWWRPARLGDLVEMRLEPLRWGNTSFELLTAGTIEGERCFEVRSVHVMVRHHTLETVRVPDEVRAAFS